MKIALLFVISCLFLSASYAQSPKFKDKYLNSVTASSLKEHVYILASDSLKGRETGTDGEHKAAKYIQTHFEEYGLKPYNDTTFLQAIGLWSWRWGQFNFSSQQIQLNNYGNMVYLSSAPLDPINDVDCIFIGNGSDSIVSKLKLEGKVAFALVNNLKSWYKIANRTRQNGAVAIVMVHKTDPDAFDQLSEQMKNKHQQLSIGRKKPIFSKTIIKAFAADQSVAEELFQLSIDSLQHLNAKQIKRLTTAQLSLACPLIIEKANANNVAAYLPGKGKTKDAVVISAHYDHIGEGYNGINVGADDNSSGTAAVMELAKALSPLKGKLDKNIIFLCTTGEEKGLLGAFYFADHPQEHGYDIKANINIDMIGRIDSTHKSNYIYTIGNNHYPEFDSLLHVANNMLEPLSIQYDYNQSHGFGNFLRLSDHYAFHRRGIPVMGFFSGLHADYHKPSDTPDKIDYAEMEKRVKLIFTTAYLAAQKTAFTSQTD
ncbi:M28 family metallopeptidase [Carboxylicivirga sp. M1479]|uniref:M28 family metallopeptidase n=1 Tax=Carboxylicivirga sp. M1479 TaxID=2594476 RepID=UPI001177A1BF|nr:M28 family peptidase [Carboxylicivirga sp. M1479]TRX65833.1 M28 family peptidase [Carboxylicivirga sp. M1479]